MTIKINSNIQSLLAQRHLAQAQSSYDSSIKKLATGQRINSASDDAAGLSIAASLNVNSKIFNQAVKNINDGISSITIAQSAISQLSNITIRQKELAEQAANGSLTATQRGSLDREASELTSEYNRIIGSTKFNGVSLLTDSITNISIQTGVGSNSTLDFSIGSALGGGSSGSIGVSSSGTAESSSLTFSGMQSFEFWDLKITADYDGTGSSSVYGTNSIYLDGTTIEFNCDGDGLYGGAIAVDLNGYMTVDQVASAIAAAGGGGLYDTQLVAADTIRFTSSTTADLNNGAFTNGSIPGSFTFGADGSKMSMGQYFTFSTPNGVGSYNDYYVYFTDSAGIGDPGIGGYTAIEALVDFNTASHSDLASAAASAINAALGASVSASSAGDGLSLQNLNSGQAHDISIGTLSGTSSASVSTQGTDSAINIVSDVFTYTSHGLSTGDRVSFQTSGGAPGGITSGNDYYIIKVDNNNFKLATSYANAIALTNINITSVGSGTQTFSYSSGASSIMASAISLTTAGSARTAISTLETRLQNIRLELGRQGAFESRLNIASSTAMAIRDNYISAESRIMDSDVAVETANMIHSQILQQSASAILAQANQQPKLAISLLSAA